MTVEACLEIQAPDPGPPFVGSGYARAIGKVTIKSSPDDPIVLCRVSAPIKTSGATDRWIAPGTAGYCLDAVDSGSATFVGGSRTLILNQVPATATALVTVEFATTNGPVSVVAARYTANLPS